MNALDLWAFGLICDFNPNHDPKSGWFTSGSVSGKIKKTKYAPSEQVNLGKVRLNPKEYARVCGEMMTRYPDIRSGENVIVRSGNFVYDVTAAENGGLDCNFKWSFKRGKSK